MIVLKWLYAAAAAASSKEVQSIFKTFQYDKYTDNSSIYMAYIVAYIINIEYFIEIGFFIFHKNYDLT